MNTTNFITGVLVGLAVGILLAPEKGTETRKKIMEKGNDLADAVKNKFRKAAEEGEELLDEAGNKVEDWTRKGKRKGKDLMEEGREKIEDIQDNAHNAFS